SVLVLYLATLTQVHTFDALSYVTSVERKPWTELLHPHHLAYGPLGSIALAVGQALGYTGGAALPLQIINATAGALGAALLYSTVRRVTGRTDAALAPAVLLVGSYAFWYYAVEIEVYTLAALFLIICLDLITRPGAWTTRRLMALGLAHGGATLFHQTNVLLCVPVLVCAALDATAHRQRPTTDDRGASWGRWMGRWLAYALVYALTVGLPYLYAMVVVSGFRSVDAAMAWLTEYARTGWWGAPVSRERLADLGQGLADTLAQPGGALLWLVLGAIALPLRRSPTANRRLPTANHRSLVPALLAWLLTYGAFFTWWEPDNVEFWIASLPPFLLLLALRLTDERPWSWRPLVTAGIAGAALVTNYGAIERRGDAATDLQRVVARELASRSTPADLLIVPDGLLELYLPYYEGHENFVSLNQAIFDARSDWTAACATVQGRIDTALHAGATVLVAEEALRPPAELLRRHRLEQRTVDACFAPYHAALAPLELPPELPGYHRLPSADELAQGEGWSFETSHWGWRAANVSGERLDGEWSFRPGADPALLSPLLALDASRYQAVEVRMASTAGARDAQLFFADADGSIDELRSARWTLAPGPEMTIYTIELRGAPGWEGIVTRLRLDPVGVGDGGEVRVESIRLVPSGR
ncbi:MAG: hypothetical protein RLZZ387_1540, partial [Chloroflexota bacterium]